MPEENDRLQSDRRLWVSVLCQAIDDATTASTVKAGEREALMRESRAWLTTPSSDLDAVCGLAGVDMQRFIAFAKATIEQVDKKPRRAKHGGRQRLITFNGETLSLGQWAQRLNLTPGALARRLDEKKWPLERALTKAGPGGGREPHNARPGPATKSRAQSAENRDSEDQELAA